MEVDNSNQIRDNKIILFANQKGGVGKTTICGLFSNYLSDTRNVSLLVIDADPSRPLLVIVKMIVVDRKIYLIKYSLLR